MEQQVFEEMKQAFLDIQQPRPPFVLRDLVVNARFTDEMQYAQCVLELSIAHDNLRTAQCNHELKQMEINDIKGEDRKSELQRELKRIELEQLERATLGAMREFDYLFNLWQNRPKKYTRQELDDAQPMEYKLRLETQALHDLQANGRISVGNLEGLRQLGISPELIALPIQRDEVERKYLEEGKIKALVIIPSEHRLSVQHISELLDHVILPTNVEMRIENISGAPVADNYNTGFEKAIEEGCTHIVTIEDDQILGADSLIKMFDFALANPECCVGARYPKRQTVRQGVHIGLKGGHRAFLEDDGEVHEVKTLAMGLSIYPTHIIKQLDFPWCKTTNTLSQDSYLSQKIRDKGYMLLVDTNIKIGHKDRDGTIYQ